MRSAQGMGGGGTIEEDHIQVGLNCPVSAYTSTPCTLLVS